LIVANEDLSIIYKLKPLTKWHLQIQSGMKNHLSPPSLMKFSQPWSIDKSVNIEELVSNFDISERSSTIRHYCHANHRDHCIQQSTFFPRKKPLYSIFQVWNQNIHQTSCKGSKSNSLFAVLKQSQSPTLSNHCLIHSS
jgi:hypothetical protein